MAGRTILKFVVVTDPTLEIGRVRLDGKELVYSGPDQQTVKGVISQRARQDDVTPEEAFDAILHDGWTNGYLVTVRSEGMLA